MARKGTKRARRSGRKGTRRQRAGGRRGNGKGFFGRIGKTIRNLCYGNECPSNSNEELNSNSIIKSARKQFDNLSDEEKISTYLWLESQPGLLDLMFPPPPISNTTYANIAPLPNRGRSNGPSRRFRASSPRTAQEEKAMKLREKEANIEMRGRVRAAQAAERAAEEQKKEAARQRFAQYLKSEELRKKFWQRVAELGAQHLRGVPSLPPTSNLETWRQLAQLPHQGKELVHSNLLRGY